MAIELNAKTGTYFHNSGSMHYYHDETSLVLKCLKEQRDAKTPSFVVDMPRCISPFDALKVVATFAEKLQAQNPNNGQASLPIPELPAYWQDICLLLVIGHLNTSRSVKERALSALSPNWKTIAEFYGANQ
jgi:hypothetical protein